MAFDPYLGWVDVPNPAQPPTGAKMITASDLLRYESGIEQNETDIATVAEAINTKADLVDGILAPSQIPVGPIETMVSDYVASQPAVVDAAAAAVDASPKITTIETELSELNGQGQRGYTIDQTVGRTVKVWDYINNREQLIYSDTGWRNIDISNVTGTIRSASSPGAMQLRREGSTVTARFAGVGLTSGTTQGNFLASGTIPVDFRGVTDGSFFSLRDTGIGFATYHTLSAAGSYVRWLSFWNGSAQSQTRPTGGSAGGEVSWHTDAPWPTSLPGTAVGTIPYQ